MRDRSFMALCALILVNQMGFGLVTPVLPAFARSFGLDAASVGLVISIYGLARFFANVPAGHLAERSGRRPVLIVGTVITSVASALIATADSLPLLLFYRLLTGLGAATVLTGGQIMVGDIATPERRGRMMSTYQGFFLVGVGLGPTPGGILADAFGVRAPFIAYAVFSALACVVALFFIRETRPALAATARTAAGAPHEAASTPAAPAQPLRATLLGAPFLLISIVSFATFFARTGAMFTVVPLLAREHIGLSASQLGLSLTAVSALGIVMLYPSGVLSDRFGRKRLIAPAMLVEATALAGFAVSGSYVAFLASALLWGFGSGISGPAPAAYVADLAPAEVRGPMYGIFRSVSDAGYIVGPLLLGSLIDHAGYAPPLLLTAALLATSGGLFWLFAPEFHQPARAPTPAART